MKALLVAAGDEPGKALFLDAVQQAELLIAVDGGLRVFDKYGVEPAFIVGDMDSVEPSLLKKYERKSCFLTAPSEKDDTDLTLAVDKAKEEGAEEIRLLGATGGRIDHLLSNLMLLKYTFQKEMSLTIEDDSQEITLHIGAFHISGQPGQTVSIIPMNRKATVTASGLYYPLEDLVLTNERPRGVSNLMLGNRAEISSDDFVFICKDKKVPLCRKEK